jgi:multimeric flavodoxin WrbA
LREPAVHQDADSLPGWRENRARMEKEYVAPREGDLVWADAVAIGAPASLSMAAPEFRSYLELMAGLHQRGKLGCKVGAAFLSAAPPAGQTDSLLAALYASLAQFHLILVPPREESADPLETARLHGRRVAEVARALKAVTA